MRPDVEEKTRKLAMKKLADRYVGRRGEPPSLAARKAAARNQDLNDDDRKHLQWCIETLRIVAWGKEVTAAFEFIEAVLARDYDLYRGVEREADTSVTVDARVDPELHRHMVAKRSRR